MLSALTTLLIRICRGAGIRFFVVTGDHPSTAVAIAAQAGIISNPATVHHASDLLDPPATPDKGNGEKEENDVTVTRDQDDNAPPQSIVITGAELVKLTPECAAGSDPRKGGGRSSKGCKKVRVLPLWVLEELPLKEA